MLYLGALTVSRVNAWLAAAGHQDGPLFRRVRRGGRVEGDPGRRLSVNAIRRIIRSRAAAVGIEGRVCIRSQSPGWWRAIAGRRRGLDCRDADGGQVAVTGDAGPLCTGRRRSRPLRSRIKPGSTSSTITSLIGGGDVVVTLTFSVNIYRAPHNTPVLTQYRHLARAALERQRPPRTCGHSPRIAARLPSVTIGSTR